MNPRLPPKYYNESSDMSKEKSKDGGSQLEKLALYEAIQACYRFDPLERPTAYELASALSSAYDMIQYNRRARKAQKIDKQTFQSDPMNPNEAVSHPHSFDEIQRLFQKGR